MFFQGKDIFERGISGDVFDHFVGRYACRGMPNGPLMAAA